MGYLSAIRSEFEERGRLFEAAQRYGQAALAGERSAAADLVRCCALAHPGNPRAARWAAETAPVDDRSEAAFPLRSMSHVGADDEVQQLAARVADSVRLDNLPGVADLIETLREASAEDRVRRLAERGSATPAR